MNRAMSYLRPPICKGIIPSTQQEPDMNHELNIDELDTVSGGTSYQEAYDNMIKWNAAITAAGQAGIEAANIFTPIPGSKGNGGSCPGQYHH
jgi:hypothetical protein